jgi:large repetitive protein
VSVMTAVLANPAQGTLTNVAGVWTFTPAASFAGTAVINYTIVDTDGGTSSSTHTIVVGRPPLSAAGDSIKTKSGAAVDGNAAINDSFVAGSQFAVTSNPQKGTVIMRPDGTYTYKPKPGFSGKDTFRYTITDPTGQTVTQTVTIDVVGKSLAHRCLTSFANVGNKLRRR